MCAQRKGVQEFSAANFTKPQNGPTRKMAALDTT